jgi:hypothetical protein
MKQIAIFNIFIILTSFIFCEKSYSPLEPESNLIGVWIEKFTRPDYGNGEVNQTSTLTLSGSSFTVKILPIIPIISSKVDTFFRGSYTVMKDMIIFKVEGDSVPQKLDYTLHGDTLKIWNHPESLGDGMMTIKLFSFLWGNAFGKYTGQFIKSKKAAF